MIWRCLTWWFRIKWDHPFDKELYDDPEEG